ncbi:uncharacterized protein LOC110450857 isoform X2 [Mizuhopecten yessoensis]|uniref:uncharacterized protein LOC110450857 isoform X2 n=1 Tax=Mizuhopecten yessoensis TaxID=6573 RepID=UPI000B458510|nr:uncharacterized protein LOC110450857 isoform X2 [Mizuhopecten yessoensis]
MKITIVHPDSEESHIRLSERKKNTMSALFKRLPPGTVIKRLGRTVDVAKECLISKVFTDDDVIEAVYTLVRMRRLWNGVKRSTQPCMITLDAVEKRAEMPCGHAIIAIF